MKANQIKQSIPYYGRIKLSSTEYSYYIPPKESRVRLMDLQTMEEGEYDFTMCIYDYLVYRGIQEKSQIYSMVHDYIFLVLMNHLLPDEVDNLERIIKRPLIDWCTLNN